MGMVQTLQYTDPSHTFGRINLDGIARPPRFEANLNFEDAEDRPPEMPEGYTNETNIVAVMTHTKGVNAMLLEVDHYEMPEDAVSVSVIRPSIERAMNRKMSSRYFYYTEYNQEENRMCMMMADALTKVEFFTESDFVKLYPPKDAFQSSSQPRITI